jgi:hypothetical protein
LAPAAHAIAVLEEQSKDGSSRYFSVNAAHGDEFFCATGVMDAKHHFVYKTHFCMVLGKSPRDTFFAALSSSCLSPPSHHFTSE